MKLFDGCLLACDVDGTLVYNGVIPERNIEKIRFFAENGGVFSLATGRSVGAVGSVISAVSDVSASVVSNGCMIYNYKTKEILYEKCVDKDDYGAVFAVEKSHPEIGIELHEKLGVLVLTRTKETDDHESYEGLNAVFINGNEVNEHSYNKILYALNGEKDIPRIRKIVEPFGKSSIFIDTSATLYGKKRFYLEQIPTGISKASGVKLLAEMLNIKKGGLFAIGDYYNDIDMLKIADVGAAPENSPKVVKDCAEFITSTAENGSVADFIDYLTELRRK